MLTEEEWLAVAEIVIKVTLRERCQLVSDYEPASLHQAAREWLRAEEAVTHRLWITDALRAKNTLLEKLKANRAA